MRTMYDAVTPQNILIANPNPQMVAGYLNGPYVWSDHDWGLFPNAVHVGISVRASFTEGDVLDVEPGDATPQDAVGWVKARRAAGADPSVYCNASTWPSVKTAFAAAGEPLPHWFAAKYDGVANLDSTPGAVAKQHSGDVPPGIDISVVADYWPGVDETPAQSDTGGGLTVADYTVKAIPSNGFNTFRMPGGPSSKLIIYPGKDATGAVAPVWCSNMFFWGNKRTGLGNNPVPAGQVLKIDTVQEFLCPNALIGELAFSAGADFVVSSVG